MQGNPDTLLPPSFDKPSDEELRGFLLFSSISHNNVWKGSKVAEFFARYSEKERAQKSTFCLEWYKYLKKHCPCQSDPLPSFFPDDATRNNAFFVSELSVFACCSYRDIVKLLPEFSIYVIHEGIEHVLKSRRPKWAGDILTEILRTSNINYACVDYWPIYRRLFNEGIVEPINDDTWVYAMFASMLYLACDDQSLHKSLEFRTNRTGVSIRDQLRADPKLLTDDLWAFFEPSNFKRDWSPSSFDSLFGRGNSRWYGDNWLDTLCIMAENHEIPKSRIVEGCFHALNFPLTDFESKWYVGLLEQMLERGILTTDEELADFRFLALLENSNPTPRSLGLKTLERLVKSNLIADKDSLRYIPTVFREPAKGKVKKAITLLERIAKKNTNIRHDVCRTALEGLRHEAAEIQQKALDLLLKYDAFSDPEIAEAVRELEPSLAASVRRNIPGRKEPPVEPKRSFVPEIPKTNSPLPRKEYIRFFKNLADSTSSVSIAATDRMIQAVSEGRFHCEQAIEAARETIGFKAFTISRWTKPLHVIAEQSDRHAEIVQKLVEGFLPEIDKKHLSVFLELLVETSSLLGKPIHSETCRNYMQTITGTGKAAKLTKKLLQL